ncbi:hypothetical protein AMEX_G2536 [Astyanax mexicanus]|uniref:CCHC-type domain-containing protein n=1 Tax=Astyanax mexicanus TaxID=7994 RepID=A0A8T2MKQ1_ASTMX|nr:hypothetical protein AMEX_G2536 [Astyanax mexicanus]
MSGINKVPLGCKSHLLKHVVSFRRRVFMVLNDNAEELNLALRFKIDGFDYVVFATTETMKCFGCGAEGHLVRSCPERAGGARPESAAADAAQPAVSRAEAPPAAEQQQQRQEEEEEEEVAAADGAVDGAGGSDEREREGEAEPGDTVLLSDSQNSECSIITDEMECGTSQAREKEPVFKRPAQRETSSRHAKKSKTSKIPKPSVSSRPRAETGSASESEDSAAECARGSSDSPRSVKRALSSSKYTPDQVHKFLNETKGKRNVKVEDFFPDLEMFLKCSKVLTRSEEEGGIGEPDVHRLRKHVTAVRKLLGHPDDDSKV